MGVGTVFEPGQGWGGGLDQGLGMLASGSDHPDSSSYRVYSVLLPPSFSGGSRGRGLQWANVSLDLRLEQTRTTYDQASPACSRGPGSGDEGGKQSERSGPRRGLPQGWGVQGVWWWDSGGGAGLADPAAPRSGLLGEGSL